MYLMKINLALAPYAPNVGSTKPLCS
jgi:hypothetical protein